MIWFYRLIFPVLFIVGLPYYLIRMFKRGGYGEMMASRFGHMDLKPKQTGKKRVWIQAVSVGELLAIESVINELSKQKNIEIVLTTTTSTGYTLAKEKYSDKTILIGSFPLDFWLFVNKAWNRIQPDLAVITEGELWPEHIQTAKKKKIPLILINARLSDRSYHRMLKAKWLQPLFYKNIYQIGASSEFDAKRITDLGYDPQKIIVSGNLKFDVVDPQGLKNEERTQLLESIGFVKPANNPEIKTVIGASTWPGEEELLIKSCLNLNEKGLKTQLLIVPRHAERRSEIKNVLANHNQINWQFRNNPEWKNLNTEGSQLHVYIADTTGELRNFIQIADVAVIGKSFPPHGQGQTPVEAVALGTPVVYGKGMSNFRAICSDLEQNNGSVKVREAEDLPAVLEKILKDGSTREVMIEAARKVYLSNRGSTLRTIEMILSHF